MSKIAKNMLPYWKSVIIILALLVVQAMCDLALPSYTSDIIDVGIQNSGVEHVVPEKITEEELQTAQFIMTDDEADVWKSLYKAQHIVLWECQSAIHNNNTVSEFEGSDVHSDLLKTSERNDSQFSVFPFLQTLHLHVLLHLILIFLQTFFTLAVKF